MKAVAGVFILLLTACSTTPSLKSSTDGGTVYASPAAVSDWQFRGRIAIRRGDEGWHASLDWQASATDYQIRISGPLGQGVMHITGRDGVVLLRTGDGQIITASEPGPLLKQVTGWDLPVAGLSYWVRGLAVPGVSKQEMRNRFGQPHHLQQSGWNISYQDFYRQQAYDWPTRIRLETGDVVVKLVIDQWQIGAVKAGNP